MIIKVTDRIYYVDHERERICPKIGIIVGDTHTLLVDVANEEEHLKEALDFLREHHYPLNLIVVPTHFHPDHIANLTLIDDCEIYCSKNTSRYINRECHVVDNAEIDLGGLSVSVISLPSLHAKGCLGVLCEGVLFVGDALYSRMKNGVEYYEKSIIGAEIKSYSNIEFDVAIFGHDVNMLGNKREIVTFLKEKMKGN
ncbi:MAG: hypothetical protein IKM20_01190 [Erysipelotrichales bacterium]|nr:hypothetical protein [Erysipelotrichales bacterium]